jgi:hypothetical protein
MFLLLDTLVNQRLTRPGWRLGSHVLFWLALFISLCYYNSISFNPYGDTPFAYLGPFRTTISLTIIYYPLVYGVGLRLFAQKRWAAGIVACLGLLLLYTIIDYTGEILVLNACHACQEAISRVQPNYLHYLNRGFFPVVSSRLISLGILFVLLVHLTPAIALKAGLEYHRQYTQNLQLSRDNIQLELNFLKAQVNPHFLFNTLNNLYGLIIHGRNAQSAETVARLSDFMRYTLYDSTEDKIPLEKEINLIKNYLELEKLRLNYTQVIFECSTDGKGYAIPPLLFMPVIENAFKYNCDTAQGSVISIKLAVQQDLLHFCIQNSFEPKSEPIKTGGIGLVNLQKRLAIYFPGKNTCQTNIKGSVYSAQLTLMLS